MARDGKIQALNTAVREALPHIREVAASNPYARPFVRVMRFGTGAQWQSDNAVPLESFTWSDLEADGITDLGTALHLLADELSDSDMPARALPPVIILVSDGRPTDDFESGIAALDATPLGQKAIRLAIAIGRDADREILRRFVGNASVPILEANTPEALARQVRWASTIGLASSSSPTMAQMGIPGTQQAPAGSQQAGLSVQMSDESGETSIRDDAATGLAGVTSEGLHHAARYDEGFHGMVLPGGEGYGGEGYDMGQKDTKGHDTADDGGERGDDEDTDIEIW
ncbi:MAG: tellurium resistance protein [Actinobacteria bacterium]|nr:tellurium resistance protein [Actinomycetota bacterium]MCL5446661.1 tellurium resistance protein [Actinomycetota bacterium]